MGFGNLMETKMWIRMNVILGVVALAIVAAFSGWFLMGSSNDKFDIPFAQRPAGDTLVLPPHGRKDQQHHRVLKADGTPLRDTTYFNDGETGVTLFGDDGRLKVYRFYSDVVIDPYAKDLPKTGLKSYFELDKDGRTWLTEKSFERDGRLSKAGTRQPDGNYVVETYFGNGVQLASKRTFAQKGWLSGEETYWENGQMKTLLVKQTVVTMEFTSWFADGKKSGSIKTSGYTETGELFYEDGQTVKMRFKRDYEWVWMAGYSVIETEYFTPDAKLVQTRRFKNDSTGVHVKATADNSAYFQEWKTIDEKRTDIMAPDNYRLKLVKVERLFGHNDVLLQMSEDGKSVTNVDYNVTLKDGTEEHHSFVLRADGSIEKETVRRGGKDQVLEGNGRRLVVPEVYLRQLAYAPPPSKLLPNQYPNMHGM